MIELEPTEHDDLGFLQMVQRIVNGAFAQLEVREVYLVQTDNWFDFKWLGFWSEWRENELTELFVPPFNPNRVLSEKHFRWDPTCSRLAPAAHNKPLHRRQAGRRRSQAVPLERVSKSAAFIWFSGNTIVNQTGSLMLYLSGAHAYAWYASFSKEQHWKIHDERRIGRKELVSFEECGQQMELGTVSAQNG